MLNILKRQAELKMGIITKDEFMELTTFRFSDFLIAKNNDRTFCNMSMSFLNLSYVVHKVDQIFYKKAVAVNEKRGGRNLAIEDAKEITRQG